MKQRQFPLFPRNVQRERLAASRPGEVVHLAGLINRNELRVADPGTMISGLDAFLAERATFVRIQKQARRLITQGGGKDTTIGAVAAAVKMKPEDVVAEIERHGIWLCLSELAGEPIESWPVFNEGE